MYISISKKVSDRFYRAMEKQRIYAVAATESNDKNRLIYFVDCEDIREAFYVGRWIGRNLDTSEAFFVENLDNKQIKVDY